MAAAKAKSKPEGASFDFAQAYAELEGIVSWFERGDADLDEGLKKFERGLELAEKCKVRLADVENKVVEIRAKFGGPPAGDDENE